MFKVVGLDLSLTHSGVVSHHFSETVTVLPKKNANLAEKAERMLKVETEVAASIFKNGRPDLVVIEEPLVGVNRKTSMESAGCWWLMVSYLTQVGLPVGKVSASCLKRFILGKKPKKTESESTKIDVMREVLNLRLEGWDIRTDHEADAFVLYAMGMAQFAEPVWKLTADQKLALEAAVWPEVNPLAQFS